MEEGTRMNCIICQKEFVKKVSTQKTCSKECQRKNGYNLKQKYIKKTLEKSGSSYRQTFLQMCKNNEKKFRATQKGIDYLKKKKQRYFKNFNGRATLLRGVHKRRLMENNLKSSYSKQELLERKNKTNGLCEICKRYLGVEYLTIDHILPISKAPQGYNYTIDDIQFVCKSCNSRKKDTMIVT